MAALPEYASADVNVAWGPVALEGFVAESFVTLSRTTNQTNNTVGADGQLATSINPDKTGTITISLMQTSDSNLLLSGIALRDDNAGRDITKGDITIADPSGSVLAIGRNCHLQTLPEVVLSTETEGRAWTFFAERLIYSNAPEGLAEVLGVAARVTGAINTFNSFTS